MRYLLLILILNPAFATCAWPQTPLSDSLVTMNYENVTLKQALIDIADRYNIRLSYSDSQLPVQDTISYHSPRTSFIKALAGLLRPLGISYNIIDGQIVLIPSNSLHSMIQGRLIDRQTGQPVPYANIAIGGTSRGTSSNEAGEFSLRPGSLPARLLISHIAYQGKTIYVYDLAAKNDIQLDPSETTLTGITVKAGKSKNYNYQVIKKAYDLLQKHPHDYKYGKAFYRQKSKRNGSYTEIFELFYDIKYTDNSIADWTVQEGRYAFQQGQDEDVFLYNKNFTLLSRLFPMSQPNTSSFIIPINQNVKKHFSIELKEVVKYNDRFVGVFDFHPLASAGLPAPSGELFIDLDNYQVLKTTGTITDPTLDIVGFGDKLSSWKNYQLHYEISYIDDARGQLQLDHIRMNHQFDYYYQNHFLGTIETTSLLAFYEHYTPAGNKRLGGPIDFHTSDMEVIDNMGYNPDFWAQNPIVKRTPLEEKLIMDFERNEAFGAVFLNTDDMVMLLPDKKNSKMVHYALSRYQTDHPAANGQTLYLHLDNDHFYSGQHIKFAAFLLDDFTKQPSIQGSVLTLTLLNPDSVVIQSEKININEGLAYGEMALPPHLPGGPYLLQGQANTEEHTTFSQHIQISDVSSPGQPPLSSIPKSDDRKINLQFYPEGQLLTGHHPTKMVFTAHTSAGTPLTASWLLTDGRDSVFATLQSNRLGIGAFMMPLTNTEQLYLSPIIDTTIKWPLPSPEKHGFSMKILQRSDQSMRLQVNQQPGLPRNLFMLSVTAGKVTSIYEKAFHGNKGIFDLPLHHLPGGINTLLLTDQRANILARRSFFIMPERLYIRLAEAVWINKKSHRAIFSFYLTDPYNHPADAFLSLGITTNEPPQLSMLHSIYLGELYDKRVPASLPNDTLAHLIDNLLIVRDNNAASSNHVLTDNPTHAPEETTPLVAEVTLPAYGTTSGQINVRQKHYKKQLAPTDSWWVPRLDIDAQGKASITLKIDTSAPKLYFTLQGVSKNGHICDQVIEVDIDDIKLPKSKRRRK